MTVINNKYLKDLKAAVEEYGEWNEVIGYLKANDLDPETTKRWIDCILEIQVILDDIKTKKNTSS
ncbi:hypothetical protein FZC76_18105 [Sutcliffiella horikoshii]|uniref:Uncharacterized protein n=1 Tax=Sutcliffiella horikoshii TaxID=79883 RepID=A0A5D4SRK4_9BACI|nr:hypothetical protein [Sutcliffiella horikoshii]TYS64476.1 hypothetical protein FZC76_18105 [Sutcliffiella horikoshii]